MMWQVMIDSLQKQTPVESAISRQRGEYKAPETIRANHDNLVKHLKQHGPCTTMTLADEFVETRTAMYSRLRRMEELGMVVKDVTGGKNPGTSIAYWRAK